jgi:hypothetical protein
MHTQIWRPDNERPGRHFVYTSRYVSFFVRILSKLSDRNNLEALARRVRKKSGDFFNHAKIWEEVCTAYLKVLTKPYMRQNGLITHSLASPPPRSGRRWEGRHSFQKSSSFNLPPQCRPSRSLGAVRYDYAPKPRDPARSR